MEAIIWNELTAGLYLKEVVTVIMRLMVAMALGAIIGLERDASGKSAGLRTHMLVAVSYTHLDVYKRQTLALKPSFMPWPA